MIYARRDIQTVQQGLSIIRQPQDVPASEAERALIDAAASAWARGDRPIRVREAGTNIAGTRCARRSVREVTDENRVRFRYEERPATVADIHIGKICRTTDEGLTEDPATFEPFQPEVRLGFSDGSVAVMPLVEPEDGPADEGDGAKGGAKRKGK